MKNGTAKRSSTMKNKDRHIALIAAKAAYEVATGEKLPGNLPYSEAARIAVHKLGIDAVAGIADAIAPITISQFKRPDGSFNSEAYDNAIKHAATMAHRREVGTHTL